ncbi:MAG: glycosyltransferase [Verrucomicrobia bacterium]|nr:glycosyltransferase [Verrucomicrobiota bacterium]
MAESAGAGRWQTDGKFFRAGAERVVMRAVTYGPFPGGWADSLDEDFSRIAAAGFNALRLYEMPGLGLLDAAWQHGLRVFGGLQWAQSADFFRRPELYASARVALARSLREIGEHPALVAVYVGNEVPADVARWMGPLRVRRAIEGLITLGRQVAPALMFAYANYPSTEYLEPENADFTAFNLYLEEESALRSYLKRLHHIAGDRPLVISEFGQDSRRNGLEQQAASLGWALPAARAVATAGLTVYAWSDRWWNAGAEVLDWDFGLLDRDGRAKPALHSVRSGFNRVPVDGPGHELSFSVIVCTRNGKERIGKCLRALEKMPDAGHEVLVVDDGSGDGTAELVAKEFPHVRLLRLAPGGLSAARNAGAAAATGDILAFTDDDCEPDPEWVARLRRVFADGRFAAVGGPNLPPRPRTWREALVCAAPGAPTHVLLDDEEAEHLPGCNLAVTQAAFAAISGFDPAFHTAGDDVDFCWRLRDAGYRLGFAAGAFVWHWRRPSVRAFLRQQIGYGRAEHLLLQKHPQRFSSRGDVCWEGFVYDGGPVRAMAESVIYHGPMGGAGYQSVLNRMLPLRGLDGRFDSASARLALRAVGFLQLRLRAWARNRTLWLGAPRATLPARPKPNAEFEIASAAGLERADFLQVLLDEGWTAGGASDGWDVEKSGTRVLLATERGDGIGKRTLVRVWGDRAVLPGALTHPQDPR